MYRAIGINRESRPHRPGLSLCRRQLLQRTGDGKPADRPCRALRLPARLLLAAHLSPAVRAGQRREPAGSDRGDGSHQVGRVRTELVSLRQQRRSASVRGGHRTVHARPGMALPGPF